MVEDSTEYRGVPELQLNDKKLNSSVREDDGVSSDTAAMSLSVSADQFVAGDGEFVIRDGRIQPGFGDGDDVGGLG